MHATSAMPACRALAARERSTASTRTRSQSPGAALFHRPRQPRTGATAPIRRPCAHRLEARHGCRFGRPSRTHPVHRPTGPTPIWTGSSNTGTACTVPMPRHPSFGGRTETGFPYRVAHVSSVRAARASWSRSSLAVAGVDSTSQEGRYRCRAIAKQRAMPPMIASRAPQAGVRTAHLDHPGQGLPGACHAAAATLTRETGHTYALRARRWNLAWRLRPGQGRAWLAALVEPRHGPLTFPRVCRATGAASLPSRRSPHHMVQIGQARDSGEWRGCGEPPRQPGAERDVSPLELFFDLASSPRVLCATGVASQSCSRRQARGVVLLSCRLLAAVPSVIGSVGTAITRRSSWSGPRGPESPGPGRVGDRRPWSR